MSTYAYITNELGERRSPVSKNHIVERWLNQTIPYYEGEKLWIHYLTPDEWHDDDFPGYWVGDDGLYQ